MATDNNVRSISMPAAAVFVAADLYKAVKVNASGQVALAAAGEAAIGLLYSTSVAIGDAVEVAVAGSIMKGRTAAAVTIGALLAANATGLLVAATLGRTNTVDAGAAVDPLLGSNVLGIALEAGGVNAVIEFLWMPIGASPTTVS